MFFDALYTNGSFHTQDARRPRAHSVGVHGGRIISLDDELPPAFFHDVHDLAGAAVVPGFNDAHCHLSYVGQALIQADLRPAVCATMDELLSTVDRACATAPAGTWVQGAGYRPKPPRRPAPHGGTAGRRQPRTSGVVDAQFAAHGGCQHSRL